MPNRRQPPADVLAARLSRLTEFVRAVRLQRNTSGGRTPTFAEMRALADEAGFVASHGFNDALLGQALRDVIGGWKAAKRAAHERLTAELPRVNVAPPRMNAERERRLNALRRHQATQTPPAERVPHA